MNNTACKPVIKSSGSLILMVREGWRHTPPALYPSIP
jgi:hypothetical protein